jgi:hypothetical protein
MVDSGFLLKLAQEQFRFIFEQLANPENGPLQRLINSKALPIEKKAKFDLTTKYRCQSLAWM